MDGLRLDRICGRNSGTEAVFTSDGDILYAAGSIVVKICNEGVNSQDFFNEHSNRVSSLAIFYAKDGMGDTVASSDTGGNDCKVCVWSSNMLSSHVTFSTRHKVSLHIHILHIKQFFPIFHKLTTLYVYLLSERCIEAFFFAFW